ncbi:hypothetical protein ACNKHW_17965 [Shigella flexneri]
MGQGADTVFSQMVAGNRGGSGQRRSRYFNSSYRRCAVRSRHLPSRQSYVAAPALRSAALL